MSVLYVRSRDLVSPAPFSVDFNDIVDTPGPFMVSIAGWVTTTDVGAGGVDFNINYLDPTSTSRVALFQNPHSLTLDDPSSAFATEWVMVNRLSGSSAFTFDCTTSFGAELGSLISYRIITTSAALVGDLQPW